MYVSLSDFATLGAKLYRELVKDILIRSALDVTELLSFFQNENGINIIKGEMSIVGPRPERQFYIDKIVEKAPYYFLLYRISPGLTSWGPIKIGYCDTVEMMIERLNYDIVYMENMNLLTDLRIIFSTIEVIFRGKGV